MRLIDATLALLQSVLALSLVYDYVLLFAGGRRAAAPVTESLPRLRYAIAIPAHNERAVIGASVTRLLQMEYPKDLFRVHVVADHCTDDTSAVARAAGAIAHERCEGPGGRKAYALAWLFERLLADSQPYDAFVVFDADSRPAPDFLKVVGHKLADGARVVQGRHMIANRCDGAFSALADVDMRLNNRIRNQAKENLGLSARLMGDGMCFHRSILEQYSWHSTQSFTEDREYGIYLVTQGKRVRFAGEAVSEGQAAVGWRDATAQRLRWHGGVFDLQKRCLGPLARAAYRKRDGAAFDLMLDLAVPSFSTLFTLAAGLTFARAGLQLLHHGSRRDLVLPLASLALAGLYPFAGLALEGAPPSAFHALSYGPLYAAWRIWISLRVSLQRGDVTWVRTRRSEELKGKPCG